MDLERLMLCTVVGYFVILWGGWLVIGDADIP